MQMNASFLNVIFLQGDVFTEANVWNSFLFSILFFFVALGIALSFSRSGSQKRTLTERNGLLKASGMYNFLIGAFVVQVAASGLYFAFSDLPYAGDYATAGIVAGIMVLLWGLLVFTSGITAFYKNSRIAIVAAILSLFVAVLTATDNLGISNFSLYVSMSFSIIPVSTILWVPLAVISMLTSVGVVAAYTKKKFAVTLSSSSPTIQVGQSQTFTAYVSGGSEPYGFQWFVNGQAVSGASRSSFGFSSSTVGSSEVYVVVTDSAVPARSVYSGVVTIKVVPVPLIAPVVVASATGVDVGQSSLLSQSKGIVGGVGPYRYQWFKRNGTTGSFAAINGATDKTYRLETDANTALGTRSFKLQVTDSLGTVATSNVVLIQVNAMPTVKIDSESVTVKAGESKWLTAVVVGGSEPYGFQWFVGGRAVSGATGSGFRFSSDVLGSSEVYAVVRDSAVPAVSVRSGIVVIKVVPVPLAAPVIVASSTGLDVGQSSLLKLSTKVFGGIAPYQHQWFRRDETTGAFVPIDGATEKYYLLETTKNTALGTWSFYVKITDSVDAAVASNVVLIQVNSAPTVTLTPESATLGVGESQVFTASVSGGTGAYKYEWYVNGRRVSSTGKTFRFSANSTGVSKISVKVTDSAYEPVSTKSKICTILTSYLPKSLADITTWLNAKEWDKVLGFDLLDFAADIETEDEFRDELAEVRDSREEWCAKKGFPSGNANAAITEAYHSLRSGRRNLLYVKRLGEGIFVEWKLTYPEDVETCKDCLTTLVQSYKNDVDVPWSYKQIKEKKQSIYSRLMEQSSLTIALHLLDEKRKRTEAALYFLKDVANRLDVNTENRLIANKLLGSTLYDLKRYSEAVPYLKNVVELRGQADDYRWLIGAHINLSNWYEAKRYGEQFGQKVGFSEALDFFHHSLVLVKLDELLTAKACANKAKELAQAAMRANPNDVNRQMLETCTDWANKLSGLSRY
jgi:tetratricopeptide (TPR) repeat protein